MKSFLIITIFSLFTATAFGGEWHSAGNAPVMPYRPSRKVRMLCTISAIDNVGTQQYFNSGTHQVLDEEFRGQRSPVVTLTLQNTGDPGLDGQSLSLRFINEETVELKVSARSGGAVADATFYGSRQVISGQSKLALEDAKPDQPSWVQVNGQCREN